MLHAQAIDVTAEAEPLHRSPHTVVGSFKVRNAAFNVIAPMSTKPWSHQAQTFVIWAKWIC